MRDRLLHIFRNTPMGREVLLQSIYFCSKTQTGLNVYIPNYRQFLMYFEDEIVTVDLDGAFLRSHKTAQRHAKKTIEEGGLEADFIEPKGYTASTLPELPVNFNYMTCPRSISDFSSRISLGHIGPRVRNIIRNSSFAVFIPTAAYKEWKSVTVFFGGSKSAARALRLGMKISSLSDFPLQIFTQAEKRPLEYYRKKMENKNLLDEIEKRKVNWLFFKKGEFRENLYEVPHDSLVVVGAYGHGLVKEVFFGSKMEQIQTVLPNNMLIVGPHLV